MKGERTGDPIGIRRTYPRSTGCYALESNERDDLLLVLNTTDKAVLKKTFGISLETLKKAARGLPIRDCLAVRLRVRELMYCCDCSARMSPGEPNRKCAVCEAKPPPVLPVYNAEIRSKFIPSGAPLTRITYATRRR